MATALTRLSTGECRWSISVPPDAPRDDLRERLELHLGTCADGGGGLVQLWVEAVTDDADALVAALGFTAYRDLYQLRCALPQAPSGLTTRPFTTHDANELITVNNRAFHWHPEQSGMTRQELDERMTEPWFDAEGFRLLELEDRLAGFCWTKVHADTDPPLGEIYVIAVDPDFHGRGLGGPLTLAGLEHLSGKGLTVGNLYVESDNHPALKVYERIGFTRHSTNRAYRATVAASS